MARGEIHEVRDLVQLKALADPLRQRLLAEFGRQAQTTKQVAERLDERPTRLYHHVQALERAGLLKLVRTRKKRGTTEKYYQAVARRFRVAPGLIGPRERGKAGAVASAAANLLDATRAELMRALSPRALRDPALVGSRLLARSSVRLTRQGALALRRKIERWIAETCRHDEPAGDAYRLSVLFYPLAPKDH